MRDIDSANERQTLWGVCRNAIKFVAAAVYFVYWNWKTPVRNALRRGSLWVLSLFMLFMVAEVASEFWHEELLQWLIESLHTYHEYALYVFIAAVVFVLWHHGHERKKPEYEYKFLQRLYETVEYSRQGTPSVVGVLEIIHSAFERSGIIHVSVHTLTVGGDGLEIRKEHVFPGTQDGDYFVSLKIGQGVAGRVFNDSLPRYMPRLFFPNWTWAVPFHHAVQLAFRTRKEGWWLKRAMRDAMEKLSGRKLKSHELELVPDGFNLNVYEGHGSKALLFRSVLCVPLKTSAGRCIGVLNFDFDSTDPLDKGDIAMAIVFGVVIGDVIGKQAVTGKTIVS